MVLRLGTRLSFFRDILNFYIRALSFITIFLLVLSLAYAYLRANLGKRLVRVRFIFANTSSTIFCD